jgi:hypothetical protein
MDIILHIKSCQGGIIQSDEQMNKVAIADKDVIIEIRQGDRWCLAPAKAARFFREALKGDCVLKIN